MIRRVLLLVISVAVLMLGAAGSATAAPIIPLPPVLGGSDCKSAPTVIQPGDGVTGFFETKPVAKDWASADATNPAVLFDVYGYAGMRWNTYDLGCALNPANLSGETTATGGTAFANWLFNAPQFAVAASASVLRVAFKPTWLRTFDPLLVGLTNTLRVDLYDKWILLALASVGILLLWRSHRGNISEAAQVAAAALAVLVIGIAVFSFPMRAGHMADNAMLAGVSQATSLSAGADNDPATDYERDMYNDVIYPFWLAGELGSATSPTAVKYGPKILMATTFSWHEQQLCQQVGPAYCANLAQVKSDSFKTIAAEIHDADPDAYAALTGHNSDQRVGFAALSAVGSVILIPFLVMSGLLVIASYLIIRLGVMVSSAVTVIGVRFPKVARLALQSVAAAVVNSIVFGLSAAVVMDVIGVTLRPGNGIPTWLGLVLAAIFGFICWHMLKPFRKLTTMISGRNIVSEAAGVVPGAARRAGRNGKSLIGAGIKAYTGGAIAGHVAADEIEDREDARRERDETTVLRTPETAESAAEPVSTAVVATPRRTADSGAATGSAPTSANSGGWPTQRMLASDADSEPTDVVAAPVDPNPDGSYEVYRPEQTPPGMTPAPVSDDGTFTVYDPRDGT